MIKKNFNKIILSLLILLLVSILPALNVGFDIDDTLIFSTPAFENAKKKTDSIYSQEYWKLVNSYPINEDMVKHKTAEILKNHIEKGDKVYIITARKGYGKEPLVNFLVKRFGVKKENIFFEPYGKTEKIKELKIDIFYGDSDSDITDAKEAGATPIRILRSPQSSYKKKYNPGKFGEKVIKDSEE